MSNSSVAELYFIIGMMVLILIVCIAATYIFFRQYKRERRKVTDREPSIDTKISDQE